MCDVSYPGTLFPRNFKLETRSRTIQNSAYHIFTDILQLWRYGKSVGSNWSWQQLLTNIVGKVVQPFSYQNKNDVCTPFLRGHHQLGCCFRTSWENRALLEVIRILHCIILTLIFVLRKICKIGVGSLTRHSNNRDIASFKTVFQCNSKVPPEILLAVTSNFLSLTLGVSPKMPTRRRWPGIDVCTDRPFLHRSVDKVSFESSFYFRYRAAELKHGRIAMLAALGQITQYYVRLGDPVFNQVRILGTSKRILLTIHCFCQQYSISEDELHSFDLLRATSLLRHTSRSSRRGLLLLYKFFLQFLL